MRLSERIRSSLRTLEKFDAKFSNAPLSFEFRADATKSQIPAKVPRILSEIAAQSSMNEDSWEFSAPVKRVLSRISLRGRVDIAGRPSFNYAFTFDGTDIVTDLILSKTLKSYNSEYPIELLGYFGPLSVGHWSGDWKARLYNALLRTGLGPFSRVWVFKEGHIEFRHPTD